MSMKHYLGLKVQAVKGRLSRDGKSQKDRIDDELPLNLRIGSRVRFAEAPFLLAGESTRVAYPGEETLLTAFSEVELAGLKTFRLYLDARDEEERSAMLMLLMDNAGEQVDERYVFEEKYELPLYHLRTSDVLAHEDETTAVDFWLAEEEGILGMPLFHTPDESTYERLWEHDQDIWLKPAKLSEIIQLDPYGDNPTEVEHLGTMLYARSFEGLSGETLEYLLATVERDADGFRVRIWVGLPLAPADIDMPDAA